jgi:hypothetical protein
MQCWIANLAVIEELKTASLIQKSITPAAFHRDLDWLAYVRISVNAAFAEL